MENFKTHANAEIYEKALKGREGTISRVLRTLGIHLGFGFLTWLAWAEPFSGRLFARLLSAGVSTAWIDFAAVPAVMILRGILMVEAFGYAYHRYFQHVGWWTRRSGIFRRNQMFHWIHHMVIYPIGRLYRRALPYVPAEPGIAWSWVVPALVAGGAALALHGPSLATACFLGSLGCYAKFVIDVTHDRFHEVDHPWINRRYFNWLEEIHLLHHWDQRYNFTIVFPAMDYLFGSYLSPKAHAAELKAAKEDRELTVSDLINWRYLLLEASPAEYAAFISQAKRHSRSLVKFGLLLEVLRARLSAHPEDVEARLLHGRALDLLSLVRVSPELPSSVRA